MGRARQACGATMRLRAARRWGGAAPAQCGGRGEERERRRRQARQARGAGMRRRRLALVQRGAERSAAASARAAQPVPRQEGRYSAGRTRAGPPVRPLTIRTQFGAPVFPEWQHHDIGLQPEPPIVG